MSETTERRVRPAFEDGERVTVTTEADRYYGETGTVDGWFYGMAGGIVYLVWIDGCGDFQRPYIESELTTGDRAI
jgi:hypothetical protein